MHKTDSKRHWEQQPRHGQAVGRGDCLLGPLSPQFRLETPPPRLHCWQSLDDQEGVHAEGLAKAFDCMQLGLLRTPSRTYWTCTLQWAFPVQLGGQHQWSVLLASS